MRVQAAVKQAPTVLRHTDYAVHPALASSLTVPREVVAPVQVRNRPGALLTRQHDSSPRWLRCTAIAAVVPALHCS